MATKLTSPYNFVPLNTKVYLPDWADQVSHDIPFEDGEDGWIEVELENISPLIIRADNKDPLPVHIEENDGKKLYFIPGSSMKGMLRSTLEILSFGKMEQYDNRFFGHREFDTKQPEGRTYKAEMENVEWGWLSKDDETYYLSQCSSDAKTIDINKLKNECPKYDIEISQWERNECFKSDGQMFPERGKGYRLYCTGKMHNKKHEYLIPTATNKKITLSPEVVRKFLTVHEPTPHFEKFLELLDKGEKIPVSYIGNGNNISTIGLSRMLRLPYKNDVKKLVETEQKPVKGRDLCETIFGYIQDKENDGSLRGRVQIGNAFCSKSLSDNDALLPEVSGVLAEPKPSFYPLYLKQTGPKYKTYNDAAGIAGRKLYRVHQSSSTSQLPQNKENENVMSKFRPLKPGLTFKMRINVHNLRPVEIGALLSSVTLHKIPNAWHNIGTAKPFGYGKLAYKNIKLNGLKHDIDHYLKDFEDEMNTFNPMWIQTEQVKRLINILSEHSNDEVKMMTIEPENQFLEVSRNFQQLTEENNPYFAEREKQDISDEKERQKAAAVEADRKRQEKIAKAEREAEEVKKKIDTAEEAERIRILNLGFANFLERKNINGQYTIDNIKSALNNADNWLKKSKRQELTENEKDDLLHTLQRLKENPHKDDRKFWSKSDAKTWNRISKLIGDERVQELLRD